LLATSTDGRVAFHAADGVFEAVFELEGSSGLLPGASLGADSLTITTELDATGSEPWVSP